MKSTACASLAASYPPPPEAIPVATDLTPSSVMVHIKVMIGNAENQAPQMVA